MVISFRPVLIAFTMSLTCVLISIKLLIGMEIGEYMIDNCFVFCFRLECRVLLGSTCKMVEFDRCQL